MSGPLDGVRVLDLTRQLVGPGAMMLLGDMGAEVIRVESLPFVEYPGQEFDQVGRMRAMMNTGRSKKSISLDLTRPEALEIVHAIARSADVCCHNFRPGVGERLMVDYETIKQHNPSIIYCEVNAFGQSGPDLHRVGFDIIAQGAAATMTPDYANPALPIPHYPPIADVTGFCLATAGILAALYHRSQTGEGQHVSTSLLHAATLNQILTLYSREDHERDFRRGLSDAARSMAEDGVGYSDIVETLEEAAGGAGGAWNPQSIYYRSYRTADGMINLGTLNIRQQQRLNEAINLNDPRFEGVDLDLDSPEVQERLQGLTPKAERIFASKTTDEWIAFLDPLSIACGPVRFLPELYDNEHMLENQMIIDYDDPWVGAVRSLGYPIRFTGTPMQVQNPMPPVGLNTDEILASIGLDTEEVTRLKEMGVAYQWVPEERGSPAVE